jgi:hypothetical protein
MFAKGMSSVVSERKQKISDADILNYYLGITKIPTRINSPLRQDNKPSFGLFSFNGIDIFYKDFATQESGSTIQLCQKMWNLSYNEAWEKIVNDLLGSSDITIKKSIVRPTVQVLSKERSNLQVKIREWAKHDIEYWNQFGITLDWLKYADVHPISHMIFNKGTNKIIVTADKYAYTYVEFKEGIITYKVYQPYNQNGFKWLNTHDGSVVSLWTKIPETSDKLVICSSLKDALCLWNNLGIPAISPQGEGYGFSDHAISDLKSRFKHIYILYDNDEPGIRDSTKLAEQTGFTNIILPNINNCKDISDLYKHLNNKQQFINILKQLFI